MIRKSLSLAVFAVSVTAMPVPSSAQTCVEAGCSDYCGPGFVQIVGQCYHVTDMGDRCVNESFRAFLNGPPLTVGTPCKSKNDEGESYIGWAAQ